MTDTNVLLIKKAIETKTEIMLIPRRSHTIKGIPLSFEENTLRVYVHTGKNVESVLISEIGSFSFPVELWNGIELNNVSILPNGLKPNPYGEPDAESLKEYAKKHPHKESEKEKEETKP
jgi:hypothetical protein